MSTVTIFCRDGACNTPGHVHGNCYNRYVATRARGVAVFTRRDWEIMRPAAVGPDLTGRQAVTR